MAQLQSRYPGYGIVYPQKSTTGLRVVRFVADGAKKIRHADGSIEYSNPHPTIMELVGGAFVYGSGQPVNKREDLEWLPPNMKEKAIAWFEGVRTIPKEAVVNEPEPTKRVEPEAQWVLSSERPDLLDLDEKPNVSTVQPPSTDKSQSAIMDSLSAIMEKLNGMETRLSDVEKGRPKISDKASLARKAHSEHMKKLWAERKAAKVTAEGVTDGESGSTGPASESVPNV